jgi:hypothetical protein
MDLQGISGRRKLGPQQENGLRKLGPQQEKVIRLYFGLGCERPHSAREKAQEFGVSAQVIAGILGAAQRRLAQEGLTSSHLREVEKATATSHHVASRTREKACRAGSGTVRIDGVAIHRAVILSYGSWKRWLCSNRHSFPSSHLDLIDCWINRVRPRSSLIKPRPCFWRTKNRRGAGRVGVPAGGRLRHQSAGRFHLHRM